MSYPVVKWVENSHKLYRITPHKTLLNSQNRRLWSMMHELLSLYAPVTSRTTRDGVKFNIRRQDDVWWVVRMDYLEDEPKVQFFMAVTETFDEVFKLRLANHEQWSQNTLTECEKSEITVPLTDNKTIELKPIRDNMFSLKCKFDEQSSPIRSLLDVANQLRKGDVVSLFISARCVPRMKWKRLCEYSWKKWNDGKVPQRNQIKASNGIKAAASIFAAATNEVLSVTEDTLKAIEGSFFKQGQSSIKLGKIEFKDMERQQLLVNGELSHETRQKLNLPAFRTRIYAVAHSEDKTRRAMLAQSVCSAFVEISSDNKLTPVTAKPSAVVECNALCNSSIDKDPVFLSSDEMGKLVQLPTAELQREYAQFVTSNQRIEVEVPAVFRNAGIFVGAVTRKDVTTEVFVPVKDDEILFTPRAFVSSPRMGKDTAIVNFVVEAKRKHNIGSVILDAIDERGGERGMADSIRDVLNPEDIIDLNLGDYDYPVYLGLQTISATKRKEKAENRIAQELTAFLMGADSDAARTEDFLLAFSKACKADPILIRAALTSEEIRQRMIEAETDEDIRDTLTLFNGNASIAGPVLTRLNKILRDDFLKPLFGQRPNPEVDWAKWISEGKIIIVRVPTRDLGPMAVRTIMHWLSMVVFLTKVAECGGKTFIIFNEPHIYETPGWLAFVERMLLEGPKYRIAPIFAFHLFNKLSKGFVDVLMSSSVSWHIGNNSSIKVFEQLKEVLQPVFTPEEAMQQVKRYQFIAAWRGLDGQYQTPFIYDSPLPAKTRYGGHDNSHLTKMHSRKYGRPLEHVVKDINRRKKFQ